MWMHYIFFLNCVLILYRYSKRSVFYIEIDMVVIYVLSRIFSKNSMELIYD